MIFRAIIAGLVVAAVSLIAHRFPRIGGILLTLPVVSIVAFVTVWWKDQELWNISKLARETLILVPLGTTVLRAAGIIRTPRARLLAAFVLDLALVSATIGLWFAFGPKIEN
ncbi:hypothetical protein [Bremerella sp. P1]|uniref:hypothetical protein n=1 Tax=Bremerella sp. P1 TaxID=3026424 RepID=UPI002368189B|nr:hypothetical protein [Bremerella sp. P1]WDI41523.1 hypothetical protein PSR63_23960 [Bremerella sp. P1]